VFVLLCFVFCALLVILSLLLVIMGQHDGLLLSGSPPILYININIYIHMNIFMTNKLCCCTRVVAYRLVKVDARLYQ